MSARSSLPPPGAPGAASGRRVSRAPSSSSSSWRASRYSRAPSVSATARYTEDYRSAGRESRVEDTRITPGHYSYLALRARTPSLDRQETPSKQLRFPKSNLGNTNNLTLLIKPSRKVGTEDFLPVEVVAVGGKVSKSSPTENFGGHSFYSSSTSSRRLNQVSQGLRDLVSFCLFWLPPRNNTTRTRATRIISSRITRDWAT